MRVWLGMAIFVMVVTSATPERSHLRHGTTAEAETREQHSHPVLTLHTRHLTDDLLLSTFVHEEYHWYETAHARETSAAIAELKAAYPRVPVGGRDGAADEESSYLHLIVCYAEYQKMKALVGAERARRAMDFWATDHYRAIYRLVLEHEAEVGEMVRKDGLLPSL